MKSKLRLFRSWSLLGAIGLLVASLSLTGCLAVAAGGAAAGTVAYIRGDLEANLGNDYERVFHATEEAISQLQFAKISAVKDALEGTVLARTASDKKVNIKVTKVSDQLTRVRIRIDIFGNEALSMTILDKIKANL
ncbi:MAG TPA: DUF3568 family protein [Opitutaceae bacterium]|nr:DUF3568 family protein [Opitutaceae bacterium]